VTVWTQRCHHIWSIIGKPGKVMDFKKWLYLLSSKGISNSPGGNGKAVGKDAGTSTVEYQTAQ